MSELIIVFIAITIFLIYSKIIRIEGESILERRKKERSKKFYNGDYIEQDKHYGIMLGQIIGVPESEEAKKVIKNMAEYSQSPPADKEKDYKKKDYNISTLELHKRLALQEQLENNIHDNPEHLKDIIYSNKEGA